MATIVGGGVLDAPQVSSPSRVICRAASPLAAVAVCGGGKVPGCFTFYAPHDAKAAIKMFAQKGNSSIDEFPFCS